MKCKMGDGRCTMCGSIRSTDWTLAVLAAGAFAALVLVWVAVL